MTGENGWEDLRERLWLAVELRRQAGSTMGEIAKAIPCGRTTVYRILNGEIERPRPSMERCIERFVKRAKALREG